MMKTILLSLIFCSFIQAQSWWWVMGDDAVAVDTVGLAYTSAFIDRVEADGGTIIDSSAVNAFYIDAMNNKYLDTLTLAVFPDCGIKKDAKDKVTILYDLSFNNNDLAQADTSKSPTAFSEYLFFDGAADFITNGNFAGVGAEEPYFIYLAVKIRAYASGDRVFDGTSGNSMGFFMGADATADFSLYSSTALTFGANQTSANTTFLMTSNWKDTESFGQINDNAAGTNGSFTVNNVDGIFLGSFGGGGSSYADINFYGLVISKCTRYSLIKTFINTKYTIY